MRLGFSEVILILIVLLFVVGPKKLPGAGAALGQALRSFRKALSGDQAQESGKTQDTASMGADTEESGKSTACADSTDTNKKA